MNDILHQRRHRFDALFGLLTGRGAAPLPPTAHLHRDVGLPEDSPQTLPSRITLHALAHRSFR
ncbi:MAG: hypothetical protein GC146_16805 [Limimaricola sp.]|uniref:hypothetical protein n=1 Tax=Limimaricola sp. TaxID=2211665 RepID=UPI001E0807C8|nr:hypothetical protein [Limimaricola sp.]MBI1418879.1 hypothetical protein [Limimaricola sp.]